MVHEAQVQMLSCPGVRHECVKLAWVRHHVHHIELRCNKVEKENEPAIKETSINPQCTIR